MAGDAASMVAARSAPVRPSLCLRKKGSATRTVPGEGVEEASCEVAVAEEKEYARGGLHLEGAVHHGVVAVAVAHREVVGVEGVEALVVVHGAGAQVPEPRDQGGDHEGWIGYELRKGQGAVGEAGPDPGGDAAQSGP